jgi:phosphotransacetylase
MKAQKTKKAQAEQTLMRIVRKLPLERVAEIIDFAQFIQSRTSAEVLGEEETPEEIRASEEKWDRLFARPESQHVLREMAQEALQDEVAGLTTEMIFDEQGNLIEPE